MECNKDEAIRAKVIAERKLTEKDFVGAKKFVLKAQALYPGLEGLSQMLMTLDVYISAENKISGEVDWYGVLGVNPSADDETVRKQYRKLALMLHPDKNKAVGADGAFKLLSEAWSLLSDKPKRLAYNQRRSLQVFQQKVPTKSGGQSAPANANCFHNFPNSATSNVKAQNNTARVRPTSVPPPSNPRTDTFWTSCHQCEVQYEYPRICLNHTFLCPICRRPFLASETAPMNYSKPSSSSAHQSYQNPGHHSANGNPFDAGRYAGAAQNSGPGRSAGLNLFNHTQVQQGPFARTAGVGTSVSSSSVAAKAANVVQQANEKLKREREETQAAGAWESPLKRRKGLDDDGNGYGRTRMGNLYGLRKGGFNNTRRVHSRVINRTSELTPLKRRNMMMAKARNEFFKKFKDCRARIAKARIEFFKKLKDWMAETVTEAVDSAKDKGKESKKENDRSFVKGNTGELNGCGVSRAMEGDQAKKPFSSTSADGDEKDLAPMSINVPDPDFHDSDQDQTESSFEDN